MEEHKNKLGWRDRIATKINDFFEFIYTTPRGIGLLVVILALGYFVGKPYIWDVPDYQPLVKIIVYGVILLFLFFVFLVTGGFKSLAITWVKTLVYFEIVSYKLSIFFVWLYMGSAMVLAAWVSIDPTVQERLVSHIETWSTLENYIFLFFVGCFNPVTWYVISLLSFLLLWLVKRVTGIDETIIVHDFLYQDADGLYKPIAKIKDSALRECYILHPDANMFFQEDIVAKIEAFPDFEGWTESNALERCLAAKERGRRVNHVYKAVSAQADKEQGQ